MHESSSQSLERLTGHPPEGDHGFVSVLSLPATSTYVVQTTLQKYKHSDSTQGKALAQTDAEGRFPPSPCVLLSMNASHRDNCESLNGDQIWAGSASPANSVNASRVRHLRHPPHVPLHSESDLLYNRSTVKDDRALPPDRTHQSLAGDVTASDMSIVLPTALEQILEVVHEGLALSRRQVP